MKKIVVTSIIFIALFSCAKNDKKNIDVSSIKAKVAVDRFDQLFYNSGESNLHEIKLKYPYLFPSNVPDSIWIQRMNNPEEQELVTQVSTTFSDFKNEMLALEDLFKHIKYYNSAFKEPSIITLISNIDYSSKIIYADSLLFISLDMYLGKNNIIYKDFPSYITQEFEPSQLIVDVAAAITDYQVVLKPQRKFLGKIINQGKKMYLLDCFLPDISDAEKMAYSEEQILWVTESELPIWTYFVENELLYSVDSELDKRFIAKAPFSKFYLDIDKDSPGRVGVWIGWQIVRSYMTNNDVTLQELINKDPEEIFKNSKYKPKK